MSNYYFDYSVNLPTGDYSTEVVFTVPTYTVKYFGTAGEEISRWRFQDGRLVDKDYHRQTCADDNCADCWA